MSWTVLLVIAAGTYAAKLSGALLAAKGGQVESLRVGLQLLPAALLTALVLVWTFDGGRRLEVDPRVVGVAVGAIAAWRRAPFLVVVVLAAAVTAGLRALA